jgi:tetratricopeptide (TPR) repeat protein
MSTATNASWVTRVAALVVALTPLATLAHQDSAIPRLLDTELSSSLPAVPQVFTLPTARALNDAIAALNEGRYDQAREALGRLRLERLNRYERGKVEQVLFDIARGERKFDEARQHLLNAIESGGLSEREIREARDQIERIDAGPAISSPA